MKRIENTEKGTTKTLQNTPKNVAEQLEQRWKLWLLWKIRPYSARLSTSRGEYPKDMETGLGTMVLLQSKRQIVYSAEKCGIYERNI
jgi:hypothetical protein